MVTNRLTVVEYLEEKQPVQSPDKTCWIPVHVLNEILSTVNTCFRSLQGRDTIIVEQNDRLAIRILELPTLIGLKTINNTGIDVLLEVATVGDDEIDSDVVRP